MFKIGLIIAIISSLLDQLSKWWFLEKTFALEYFNPIANFSLANGIHILPFFNLVTVWNKGVSFGILSNDAQMGAWLLAAMASIVVIILLFWLRKITTIWMASALGFIIGGAIGNIIDRLHFNAVFDYFDFHAMGYHWPAFNVADCFIFIGVGLILCDGLFAKKAITK